MIDRAKLRNALEELDGLVDEAGDTLDLLDNAHERGVGDVAPTVGELSENVVGILVAAAGLVEEVTLNK